MQTGDNVWVKVSRDKERLVTFMRHIEDSNVEVLDPATGAPVIFPLGDIRENEKDVATKHDSDKVRLELIPASGIDGIGRAMTFGSKKYADHNWANGFEWDRLVGSCLRHINAWRSGQDKDPESGLSHLDHAGACITMLIAHETEGLGHDNRRKTDG